MMQNACLHEFPFVDSEREKGDAADDDSCQYWGIGPLVETAAEIHSHQEQSQSCREKSTSRKIQAGKLLNEGEVVQPRVSFWWFVAKE